MITKKSFTFQIAKIQSLLWLALIAAFSIALVSPYYAQAESLQQQIDRLNKEISNNQAAANTKSDEAKSLKATIAAIDNEIIVAQQALSLTNLEVTKTNADIERANADLEKQKGVLKQNLKLIYKQGEVTPIEVVASSKNLSDFVAQQQYYSAIKKRIDENLGKIDKLKKELSVKKDQQVALSTKQRAQVEGIAAKRAQQASILAQTQGEEANFNKVVASLASARKQAEAQAAAQAAAAVAAYKTGNLVSLGSVSAGQTIGYMGNTGNSTGTHLHFSVISPGGQFVNPNGSPFNYANVTSGSVTQGYGPSSCSVCGYSFHNGVDIAGGGNPPVRAAASGQIIFNGWDSYGFGHKVMILHPNGYVTLYGHLLP